MGRKSSEISSQDVFPRHSNRTSLNFADDTPVCNEWTISLLESRDVTHQVGLAAINNNTGRITLTQNACANYNYVDCGLCYILKDVTPC
ncbi:hypothetical protein E3Q10_01607 [Wallemia mellicola]|uniref:Uncharacterized protein n=1 Tax=Wallemia mellicola TaxID=1708541 RepID=A0A4T0R1J4_9BASI|nr:hypothetical protein E3Q17_01363 [Wallemia mellicola]TIC31415.1 hypothetical protein E3Q10_01607 [Wallemia mellicola]